MQLNYDDSLTRSRGAVKVRAGRVDDTIFQKHTTSYELPTAHIREYVRAVFETTIH